MALILTVSGLARVGAAPNAVRVLIWDEQQPRQKEVYPDFIGNELARHFAKLEGFTVRSANLGESEQGLSPAALDGCDVLIWWGHVRQLEITPETAKGIVARIKAGRLSFIALHSAHWSMPFVEAMAERARMDALQALEPAERAGATFVESRQYGKLNTVPKATDRLTPAVSYRKPLDGPVEISLVLPVCVFPDYKAHGKPSQVRMLLPDHPIVHGLPRQFAIAQTEMYNEPFHVPPPDQVIFEERWETGEWFRSGSLWNIGQGKVFYFRPGHETFPVFRDPNVLRILENAARWLAAATAKQR